MAPCLGKGTLTLKSLIGVSTRFSLYPRVSISFKEMSLMCPNNPIGSYPGVGGATTYPFHLTSTPLAKEERGENRIGSMCRGSLR